MGMDADFKFDGYADHEAEDQYRYVDLMEGHCWIASVISIGVM